MSVETQGTTSSNGHTTATLSPHGHEYTRLVHPRYGVIWVGIVTVTPQMAKRFLEQLMPMQRRPRQKHLASLTRDMHDNLFLFTGEPIIFDVNGYMVQGQHRCLACVESGEAFDVLVVRGVPANAYEGMDITAKRSAADALAKDNCTNTANTASITAQVASYRLGVGDFDVAVHSPIVVRRVYEEERDLIDRAVAATNQLRGFRQGIQSLGYAYFRFAEIDPDAAAEFYDKLATGEQLDRGNPILTLRNYLFNNKLTRNDLLRVLFYVWNTWRKGKSLVVIRVPSDSRLPELV